MTPKEKAKDLVDKFLPQIRGADRYNYNLESMNVFNAKQCALIAVDEILNIPNIEGSSNGHMVDEGYAKVYWQKVKTEIENL